MKSKRGVLLKCKTCHKDFYVNPARISSRKFCSRKCASKSFEKESNRVCVVCGKNFHCVPSQLVSRKEPTCSRECLHKKRRSKYSTQKRRRVLIDNVQGKANLYARLRDCSGKNGANCISCGVWKEYGELQGGHFIPTTSSAIRFDERNINAQCKRCNLWLSGNSRHYLKAMVIKYGQEVVDELEAKEFVPKKWTEEELLGLSRYYSDKIKILAKTKEL